MPSESGDQRVTEETQLMTAAGGLHPLTKERRELLLGMYQENRCQARHYETVRATVVSFTLAGAIAIAAVTAENGLHAEDRRLILVLVVIGVYGTIFTSHYFKRIEYYQQLAKEFLQALDRLFGPKELPQSPWTLEAIEKSAEENYKEKFSWRGLRRNKLKIGELFRMYWPMTISLLSLLIIVWRFGWHIVIP